MIKLKFVLYKLTFFFKVFVLKQYLLYISSYDILKGLCLNLETFKKYYIHSDIINDNLFMKLKILRISIPKGLRPTEILFQK